MNQKSLRLTNVRFKEFEIQKMSDYQYKVSISNPECQLLNHKVEVSTESVNTKRSMSYWLFKMTGFLVRFNATLTNVI